MTTPKYLVTLTDSGQWMHAAGSDFLFAYLEDNWSADLKKKVGDAFQSNLKMPSTIKEHVKDKSGQDVVNGLYLLNQPAMTAAMNSIEGMGMTAVDQQSQSGSGTAVTINQQFFKAVLGGLGGDVVPMLTYLNSQMQTIQGQTQQSTVSENFGTVFGLVSVMEGLDVVETNFQYVYSTAATSQWFVKVNCGSAEHYSYSYGYTVVNYSYTP
jgi:hypothetical protein